MRRVSSSDRSAQGAGPPPLLFFVSAMQLRVPALHAAAEETVILPQIQQQLRSGYGKLRNSPDDLRGSLEDCARETGDQRVLDLRAEDLDFDRSRLEVNRQYTVDRVFVEGRELLETLLRMRWRLLRPVEPVFFITSDRPVAVINPKAPEQDLRIQGAEVTLPLTKEVLLLGDWGGPPGMYWASVTTRGVAQMNLLRTGVGLTLYAANPISRGVRLFPSLERRSKPHSQTPMVAPPSTGAECCPAAKTPGIERRL
jgi:hypothetical protein